MRTTRELLYGLRILWELGQAKDTHLSARAISAELGIPEASARRILLRLRKAGFLAAEKGRDGGYKLAKPPEKIPILSVMEAISEGKPALLLLPEKGRRAKPLLPERGDPTTPFWEHLEERFWAELRDKTLADLL